MPINVAQMVVTVGANTAMAEQGIMGLARMLGTGGILSIGAIGAGLAVAGIGAAAIHMAGNFQTALTQIVTGAGESQANLGLILAGILQMARDTGTSTKQLTDGLYMIESGGYHGAQALAILKAAAEGAKVGAADLGVTADATDTILKNYPDVVNGASGAVNTLIATVAHGKTHMQDLATALSAVLPAAAAAGIGLNDVMAAMAAQTAAGVPAADAATHLRQMLIALEAPSSAAKKALEAVGLTTDEVATAMHKSLPGALQLIQQHVEKFYKVGSPGYVEAMKNISGGMREMQGMLVLTSATGMKNFSADVGLIAGQVSAGGKQIAGWNLVQQTFNQQLDRLGEIFQTLMIQLGQRFLPVATQVAKFFADTFGPLISGTAKPVQTVADALHGMSQPLDLVGGAMRRLTDPVRQASYAVSTMTEPLHTVGGAMRSMVGGVKTLRQEYSTLVKPINDLAGPLAGLLGDWDAIKIAMQNASQTLSGDTQPILTQLHDFLVQQLIPAVSQVAEFTARTLIPAFAQIADFVLKNVVPALIQLYGWFLKNVLPVLLELVRVIITNVVPVIESLAKTIITKWIPPLERIGKDILPLLIPLFQALGWLFQNVIGPVLGMVADNIGKLLNGIADLADGISNFVHNPSIQSFEGLMKGIANAGNGAINTMTGGMFSKFLPHFASGGVMGQTGLALVGESGPEIVKMPGGAEITPLASFGGGLPSGGGGFPSSITIQITNTMDSRVVGRQMLKVMPNQIRMGTGTRAF